MSEPDKPIVAKFWYRFFPELRYFRSREELREAEELFRRHGNRSRRTWIAILFVAVVP